ncbi:MAG: uroporphyrinogen-III synthase, partial [Candidatus Acidiferrales bacterium]
MENPLSGKRIVVTRSPEQAGPLSASLKSRGAHVIPLAFVEFREPEDWGALDRNLAKLREFDWVVFTSQNAVRFFCRRLRELGRDPKSIAGPPPHYVTFGPATSEAAAKEGLGAALVVAGGRTGREFVLELWREARGKKILLPRSDRATDHMAEGLTEAGAEVTVAEAYRTCMPSTFQSEELENVRREGADVFIFASPSAFHNFAKVVAGDELKRFARTTVFATIGPTTAAAIRDAGIPVAVEAAKSSAEGIVEALVKYFEKSAS